MEIWRECVIIRMACEMVHVHRRTMYNWIKLGKVEYRKNARGLYLIYVDTLWRKHSRERVVRVPEISILKIKEVGAYLSVSRRTVYNLISAGMLKYYRTAGGSIRVVEEGLWSLKLDRLNSKK